MQLQEPEEAIQYYEKALDKDREDLVLIREVGRALVMTHDYNRAIKYLEIASTSTFIYEVPAPNLYTKTEVNNGLDNKRDERIAGNLC